MCFQKLFFLLLLIIYHSNTLYADESTPIHILGGVPRTSLFDNHQTLDTLTDKERSWLRQKKQLTIAVSLPDNPPMDIFNDDRFYDGMTSDVIFSIGGKLGLRVFARVYPSRYEAMNAVRTGEVDLIGTVNSDNVESGLELTLAYIDDNPSIFSSSNKILSPMDIERLAIHEGYHPFLAISAVFKNATLDIYPSHHQAMSAAAYGKADAALIDQLSGNYLTNLYYKEALVFQQRVDIPTTGFSFAVSEGSLLKEIINKSLHALPHNYKSTLAKRWRGGGISVVSPNGLGLSQLEKEFIKTKKLIKIAINEQLPPLSFLDENGNPSGFLIDFARAIAARLGVTVDFVKVSQLSPSNNPLENEGADMLFINAKSPNVSKYVFTKPLVDELYTFVVKNEGAINDDYIPNSQSVIAVVSGYVNPQVVSEKFELKKLMLFSDVEAALDCVWRAECEAAILPMRVAKSFLYPEYSGRLLMTKVNDTLGRGVINLAALPAHKILVDVIDKAILSIPSDELDGMANRWVKRVKHPRLRWGDIYREYSLFIFLSLSIAILGGGWIFLLRLQVRHRREAENALSIQLDFIETLVDSTPHPIYACDKSGKIVLCNMAYANFIGISKEDLLGSLLWESEPRWSFMSPLYQPFQQVLEGGRFLSGDYRLQSSGEVIDVYHWLQAYRDSLGNISGTVGGWIDVSERTRLLDDLAQASRQAQEANRAKSTFLATMSHEIRTPMNAIIGLLELSLQRRRLHEEDQASLATAYDSARDLLTLIGNILDISKIESGHLNLESQPHDIIVLTRAVISVFSALAREKGICLDLHSEGSYWVLIDALRYKQILSNLISNAIKYTDEGMVKVDLTTNVEDDLCRLQVVVRDTGIGIEATELTKLFQPFSQAAQPEHIQQSGTGLGLMISRSLCVSMGGTLTLESQPGKGTDVFVSIPLPIAEADTKSLNDREAVGEGLRRLRVMIVDDHPTNRLLISQQLAYLGHDCITAESGEHAFMLFRMSDIDVIITDFNMPGMNGFELTRRCRAYEQLEAGKRCVILGLTADARKEQVSEAYASGMDDCLFKPMGLEVLSRSLRQHLCYDEQREVSLCLEEMMQNLVKLTGDQPALIPLLLTEFVRVSDEDLLALQQAALAVDVEAFLDLIHRLKGAARIIGARHLVTVCNEVEAEACKGDRVSLLSGQARLQAPYRLVKLACAKIVTS
ncbi:transporter substrate-binding domain-containing protein [Aeromonas salmonicida]|uniref:ATP-binding protein n=1 Tax=Aeromonas salmonicida TaxID=645 RepID=UPI00259D4ACF|nr:transporter substrate-binding domain-containing protein [Aeromonas salmonicida]MDM5065439.1 transporter substrate-binding domain-containing protein [Aeromonas salmonicida]